MIRYTGKQITGTYALTHIRVYKDGTYYESVCTEEGISSVCNIRPMSIDGALCAIRDFAKETSHGLDLLIVDESLTLGQAKLVKRILESVEKRPV